MYVKTVLTVKASLRDQSKNIPSVIFPKKRLLPLYDNKGSLFYPSPQ